MARAPAAAPAAASRSEARTADLLRSLRIAVGLCRSLVPVPGEDPEKLEEEELELEDAGGGGGDDGGGGGGDGDGGDDGGDAKSPPRSLCMSAAGGAGGEGRKGLGLGREGARELELGGLVWFSFFGFLSWAKLYPTTICRGRLGLGLGLALALALGLALLQCVCRPRVLLAS